MILTNIPKFYIPFGVFSYHKQLVTRFHLLLDVCQTHFSEEDYQGASVYLSKVKQLYIAYFFVMGIKKRLYFGETLAEIEADFDMEAIIYNLNCSGINLYDIYDIFGIDYT